eukprot:3433184-Amphidinium_carterae.1
MIATLSYLEPTEPAQLLRQPRKDSRAADRGETNEANSKTQSKHVRQPRVLELCCMSDLLCAIAQRCRAIMYLCGDFVHPLAHKMQHKRGRTSALYQAPMWCNGIAFKAVMYQGRACQDNNDV